MSGNRGMGTESRVSSVLRDRKWLRGKRAVLCVMGLFITLGVAGLLMENVMAAKSKERVLDCPVTTAVAHHHDSSCYDESGELVCTLPVQDLHTHTKSCYERKLTCTIPEGEGAHKHDDSCYDDDHNLICELEESEGHQHTDSCYKDVLICDKKEITEEHVHGDGCFHTIATDDDAAQTEQPAATFSKTVRDDKDNVVLTVSAAAPEGALPDGTTMEAKLVENDDVDKDILQKAVDEKAAKLETLESGKVIDFRAVDITFLDSEGTSIEPKKDVTVKLVSELADGEDQTVVMHLEDAKPDKAERKAEVIDTLSKKQLARRGETLGKGQVAFDASSFSTYVIATVSAHAEMYSELQDAAVTLNADAEAGIPADATLVVDEVAKAEKDYDSYLSRTTEATEIDKDDVGLARFFDITINDAEGNEIQPQAPVDVKIELKSIPEDSTDFKLVHFAEDADGEQADAPEEVAAGGENGTTTFTAESFSVYGIVYTVDFGYQVGDQVFEYKISGGGTIGMSELVKELHIYEDAPKKYDSVKKFVAGIDKVEFSNTDLVYVKKIEEKTSVFDFTQKEGISVRFSSDITDEEHDKAINKEYENEWVLFSLQPFSTNEMLTITMADASTYYISVTDDWDDGIDWTDNTHQVVKTIDNPAGTKMEFFDYWVMDSDTPPNSADLPRRKSWPGKIDNGDEYSFQAYNFQGQNQGYQWNGQGNLVRGGGSFQGINKGHDLKFVPGADSTVVTSQGVVNHDKSQNLNDYTGDNNPHQGIVQNVLVNGFPALSGHLGTGSTESLNYLFDNTQVQGKKKWNSVNQLLYKDQEGYYTYDSRKVDATFHDNNDGTGYFSLRKQVYTAERMGFWPFESPHGAQNNDENWWFGLHANVKFLQPEGGKIIDDSNQRKTMQFEFSGDDDAWVYIDGVLIGDGGGIHNRTKITINFETGQVIVTGEDWYNNHGGSRVTETTLRALFRAAGKEGDVQWNGDTFADNTKHIFDFYYLERGGSESNLYLHYNLQAITDFQAKKSYVSEDDSPLQKDQFRFLLFGSDGMLAYDNDGNGNPVDSDSDGMPDAPTVVDANAKAVMPYATSSGQGTCDSPKLIEIDQNFETGLPAPNDMRTIHGQAYYTGNDAMGNVLFGTAKIPDYVLQYMQDNPNKIPAFRYIIMEYVPDNAVNAYGKRYADSTLREKQQGGYYLNGVLYDPYIYYMECRIVNEVVIGPDGNPVIDSNQQQETQLVLKRAFYEDVYFDDFDEDTDGMTLLFENEYIVPVSVTVNKTDNGGDPLSGAEFSYGYATRDDTTGVWSYATGATIQTATSDANGEANFDEMPPGYYLLKETQAPQYFKSGEYMWLVEMRHDASDPDHPKIAPRYKKIGLDGKEISGEDWQDINIVNTHNAPIDVINEPDNIFKIKVQKQWEDIESDSPELANSQLKVTLGRYTLSKRFGTINIVKKGVPALTDDLQVGIWYVVMKVTPNPSDPSNPTTELVTTIAHNVWDGTDQTIATLKVPVEDGGTTYQVQEIVVADADAAYDIEHTPTTHIISDTVTQNSTTDYEFGATYTPKKEHVLVKAELQDSRSDTTTPIDTDNVYYVLRNSKGTEIARASYDDVIAAGASGYDFGEVPTGYHSVTVEGWPDVADAVMTIVPDSSNEHQGSEYFVLEEGTPHTSYFTTTYADKGKCVVTVMGYQRADADTAVEIANFEVFTGTTQKISFDVAPGSTDYTDNTRLVYQDDVIVGSYPHNASYDITWDGGTPDGTDPDTVRTGSVEIYVQDGVASMQVWIGVENVGPTETEIKAAITNVDVTKVRGTRSTKSLAAKLTGDGEGSADILDSIAAQNSVEQQLEAARAESGEPTVTMNQVGATVNTVIEGDADGSLLRTLSGGDDTVSLLGDAQTSGATALRAGLRASDNEVVLSWDPDNGPGEPPADSKDAAYTPDTTFLRWSSQNPIILTQAENDDGNGYWKWDTTDAATYPAYNSKGEKYYYYIAEVEELNMPDGTSGEILTDPTDSTKQRLAYFIEPDPSDPTNIPETTPLAFKNKVANPVDVELIKVDKDNSNTTLEGAKFHLQKKNGQAWETVLEPDLEAITSGETFTLDNTTGIFTVPKHGVKVKGLLFGEYRFVEDECPPGYVMSTTEFGFEVTRAGTLDNVDSTIIYDDTKAPTSLLIPNPPGSELPHAGGIGTTIFQIAGAALMAAGALVLVRRRREA